MSEEVERGERRLLWAKEHMRILTKAREEIKSSGVLKGLKISMALHVEAKTGALALALKEAGANVRLASCNPLSSDDSVVAALKGKYRVETFARKGETRQEYYENLNKALDLRPNLVIDDGADLITLLHTARTELLDSVRGGNEETTTGVIRLKAMERDGKLRFPVIDVNDARMKHLFDNRYGTGQSTLDGIMTATNLLIAGKTFVVAGYGWCGRGIALRAKGMGARVIVTEVDPVKAIEAHMDGFEVMPMLDAARRADLIVSATGCKDVVTERCFNVIKDRCILANSGHFDNEISKSDLERIAISKRRVREYVDEYRLKDGRRVYLLADGRLVNLVAGQGHPVDIMDMSFAIQALSAAYLALHSAEMSEGVHPVPQSIDEKVARLKLEEIGLGIDSLTATQRKYLAGWGEGT